MKLTSNTFRLINMQVRQLAAQFCMEAPDSWKVVFSEASKTRPQEEKYHAMIGDIAKQCTFGDVLKNADDWKRMLIDAFAKVKADEGKPLPGVGRVALSFDGERVVQLGIQSRDFGKEIASEFIEHLYAWGADHEPPVIWTEKPRPERVYD